MLKCSNVVKQASDYIDAQLTLRQKISMRIHLLMCIHCRRFVAHLQSAVIFFEHMQARQVSEVEAEKIVRTVISENK